MAVECNLCPFHCSSGETREVVVDTHPIRTVVVTVKSVDGRLLDVAKNPKGTPIVTQAVHNLDASDAPTQKGSGICEISGLTVTYTSAKK